MSDTYGELKIISLALISPLQTHTSITMFKDDMAKNTMTLQQATLPTPQFDKIQLADLKQQIERSIQDGQNFLNQLTEVPQLAEAQLQILNQVDQLENNMSESWGILSHLNAVMNNAETREVYQSLLPSLSEYYTQLGQHTPLYQTYQQIHDLSLIHI